MGKGASTEQVVREIQRRTRRRFSAEEKVRIVLEGLRGEESVAALCRREGLAPNLYYRWSKEFLEAGKKRLLSDNGPCYVSQALGAYLTQHGLTHTRGAPYHPMTQGKIERYHRSMKNVVKLDVYHSPWELERAIGRFVEHYNHGRLHESLQNVTPADVYEGRQGTILERRARIKRETLARRKRENLTAA